MCPTPTLEPTLVCSGARDHFGGTTQLPPSRVRNITDVVRWLFIGLDGMNTARSTAVGAVLARSGLAGTFLGNLEKQPENAVSFLAG